MITPDTKNWIWVLERRCEDCGFDAASFDAARAGEALRDQVARWQSVLQSGEVRDRPEPGKWSPLEYGCHVRDVYHKFDERLSRMITEVEPRFENWDQDATAVEGRYNLQDPVVVAEQLGAVGLELAARFDSVFGDQWSRVGIRGDGTVFTITTLAKYLMHDPVHHLWDVGADVPRYE